MNMLSLLKVARSIVNNVIQTIRQQANVIQDAVTAPIRSWVQQVLGGIWKGDGANRFVHEMTNEVIKELEMLILSLTSFGGLVNDAIAIMDQADHDTTQVANGLFDIFHSIVNF